MSDTNGPVFDTNVESATDVVSIRFEKRRLGDFIINLLGQRRRISQRFRVLFNIDWNWIYNLDSLIIQRVESQNEGSLVDFSCRIYFSDGRVNHIISRSDFSSYRDISGWDSIAVEIIWTFIVQFPTAPFPEKQEIRFWATTHSTEIEESYVKSFFRGRKFTIEDEDLSVDVYYSNITWGNDLLGLIANHVRSSFSPREHFGTKTFGMVNRFFNVIILLVFTFSMFGGLTADKSIHDEDLNRRFTELMRQNAVNLDVINHKINLIMSKFVRDEWFPWKSFVLSTTSVILLVVILNTFGYLIRPSFIVLNDATQIKKDKLLKKRYFIMCLIGLTFIVGTASSIFAGHIDRAISAFLK